MTALIIIQAIIAAVVVSAGIYITVTGKEITISYGRADDKSGAIVNQPSISDAKESIISTPINTDL